MSKVIIIDDEPLARSIVKEYLQEYNEVQVVAECNDGFEGLKAIQLHEPDLIFLDIQMPKINGFEMLELLDQVPPVIFATAFDEYAIKAFETFSIDYLLKPIKEERLEQSIGKLKQFGKVDPPIDIAGLQKIIQQFKTPQKATALPIKTGDRITLLRYENIVYMEAHDKYVFVFTTDGQKHLTDQSLTILSEKLPQQFYRIQKSYIINKERIKEMHRHFNSRYLFIMDDKAGTRLTSGRTYHDAIREEFGL